VRAFKEFERAREPLEVIRRGRRAEKVDMQKQVLIVDDEEAVCQMVGKVLTSAGMGSLALTRSSQALDLLNQASSGRTNNEFMARPWSVIEHFYS
jgi:PleD family two-component response regulator